MKTILKLCLLVLPLIVLAEDATVQQLFSVQTVKVKKEVRSQSVKNYGYVKADEARVYDVSPRFGGYVVHLQANKIYKRVKKGEALASVYSPEVFKAKEEYLNAHDYTKKRKSKGMLGSAKLKLQLLGVSEAEIKAIVSQGKASPNTTIYSPADGYVFVKNIDNGSAFKSKQKLFSIVNIDEVWVEVKLFQEQRESLKDISSYELNFKGIEHTYKTSTRLLYPELDPKEATLTLRLRVKNASNKLYPGMYASVLSLKESKEQLLLPTTAVIRKNGTYYVFMVGEFKGEYEPIEVSVKQFDLNSYVIIDGLKDGDEVVDNALFMMDSDAQINGLY